MANTEQERAHEQTCEKRGKVWSEPERQLLVQLVAEDERLHGTSTKRITVPLITFLFRPIPELTPSQREIHLKTSCCKPTDACQVNFILFILFTKLLSQLSLLSINSTFCFPIYSYSSKGKAATKKQLDLWQDVTDRVNLKFGNQRSAYACIVYWQKKMSSCLVAKKDEPGCRESSAQMGHVDVAESSFSTADPTGSRKRQTRTSERHSSDAHPDDRGHPETEAKRKTAGSQQSYADSSSPAVHEDNWQSSTSLFAFPRTSTRDSFL